MDAVSEPLDQVLGEARRAALDPRLTLVRNWKDAAPGRVVVGSFAWPFPVELVEAVGALHVALPAGEPAGPAPPAHHNGCDTVHQVLDQDREGHLDVLDLVVLSAHCAEAGHLGARLVEHRPGRPVHLLFSSGNRPQARWEQDLRALAPALEQACGRRITPLYLRAAIHLIERQRLLLSALFALRDERPGTVPLAAAHALLRLGRVIPVRLHCEILEQALALLADRPPAQRAPSRVLVAGPYCEPPPLALLDAIDAASVHAVDDDWLWEVPRPLSPRSDGDPFTVLAEVMMAATAAPPRPFGRQDDPGAALLDRVRKRRASAVLLAAPRTCAAAHQGFDAMRAALDVARIPHLTLDYRPGAPVTSADRDDLARLGRCA